MRSLLWALILLVSSCCRADLAVVMAEEAAIDELNQDQVANLFLSRTNRLPNGDRAMPIEWQGNPLKAFFYQKIAAKTAAQLNSYWATLIFTGKGRPPLQLGSVEEVIARLVSNHSAVAVLPVEVLRPNLKVVYVFRDTPG